MRDSHTPLNCFADLCALPHDVFLYCKPHLVRVSTDLFLKIVTLFVNKHGSNVFGIILDSNPRSHLCFSKYKFDITFEIYQLYGEEKYREETSTNL